MAEFKYDVLAELGIIEAGTNYDIIAKIISWNGKEPKLDIRKWNKEDGKMSKGISISLDCVDRLKEVLNNVEDSYELPNDSINM